MTGIHGGPICYAPRPHSAHPSQMRELRLASWLRKVTCLRADEAMAIIALDHSRALTRKVKVQSWTPDELVRMEVQTLEEK